MTEVADGVSPEAASKIAKSSMTGADDESGRRRNAVRICFTGGTCGLLAYAFYLVHHVTFTAPLIACMALTFVYFALPLLLKTKLSLRAFALICFLWMEVVLFATAFNFGGFASPVWPWFGAVPVLTYYYLRGRDRVIVFAALVIGIFVIALFDILGHQFRSTIPVDQFPMVYMGSTIFAIIFIGAVTRVFTSLSRQSHRELKAVKNEALKKQKDAELANAAKTQFLANMSHELRTPLNAIIGFTDLIRTEMLGPIGNAKYTEYNTDINSSATHLLHVIEDILNYSRLETKKVKIFASVINLKDLVREVTKQVKFRPEMQWLSISEQYEDNLPFLSGDERLIKQVLINLMVNAVKFTGEGGRITIAANTDFKGGVRITVRDTGVGIPLNDIEHVTEPFFKSTQGSLVAAEGTGLGLAIAQEFMTLHGGQLSIESHVGSGTEFTCAFPQWRSFSQDDILDAAHKNDVA